MELEQKSTAAYQQHSVSRLLVQDNHNQDADGDHDDDDVGDYGPFNSKHIQYNSSYDRFYVNRSAHAPAPPPPLPHHLPNPACIYIWVTNHWR